MMMLLSAPPAAGEIDDLIAAAAQEHGLPSPLVHAVVRVESGYRPDAVSSKGAMGLMQLMPATAEELGVGDPLSPAENLAGGCRYLRALWDRFGDLELALAAYNAGPGAVESAGGVPEFEETREYVARVIEAYRGASGNRARTLLAAAASSVPSGILVPLDHDSNHTTLVAWGPR